LDNCFRGSTQPSQLLEGFKICELQPLPSSIVEEATLEMNMAFAAELSSSLFSANEVTIDDVKMHSFVLAKGVTA
jgi:hypothetical protein